MPVRIRLQRHGKKGKPFYWIVAADSRSKRDGRYLEKLGIYNPNTNPATVELDIEGAEYIVLDKLIQSGVITRINELYCDEILLQGKYIVLPFLFNNNPTLSLGSSIFA